MASDRNGSHDVGSIIGSDQTRFQQGRETHPEEGMLPARRKNLHPFACDPVFDSFDPFPRFGHLGQDGIVRIQEYASVVCVNIVIELPLGFLDAVEGAETQQMGLTDVGDEAVVRLADHAETADVVRMAGAHFDDGKLGSGVDFQQGKGHADIVIQIAFSGRDTVACREHLRDQILRGGLAVRTGQADDRQPLPVHKRPLAVLPC